MGINTDKRQEDTKMNLVVEILILIVCIQYIGLEGWIADGIWILFILLKLFGYVISTIVISLLNMLKND